MTRTPSWLAAAWPARAGVLPWNTASIEARAQAPARGAISGSGAAVVDGTLYIGSGDAIPSGASAGNVLLAFGAD